MKKITKIAFLCIFLTFILVGSVFAAENEYILVKEYIYQNAQKYSLGSASIEVLIGSGDFVQYQDDEYITVSPTPDEIRTDSYGNKYAYFNLDGIEPAKKFKITVKRKVTAGTYIETIPARSNTEITTENEKYLLPQEGIECDNDEIISKAKELTEDAASDYKKAEAIFEFINLGMVYDASDKYMNMENLSAVTTLHEMRGVCKDFAILYVAMCRAVQIPSRVVTGCSIIEKDTNASGDVLQEKKIENHAWTEIYLQDFGWVPVDPTSVYMVGSQKKVNRNAFCKITNPEYIASGIMAYDDTHADIRYTRSLQEVSVKETLLEVDKMEDAGQNSFEDLSGYDWAKESIQFLYGINVVKGYSDTEYKPQNNISRIEFISMLARALRYKETPYEEKGMVYYFLDYNQEHWSKEDYDYLMRCYQYIDSSSDMASLGYYTIAEVFDTGSLDMNKAITRAEVVALMDIFLPDESAPTKLKDIRGQKFEKSIIKAYNSGLIVGYPDLTFKPNNKITRAEMAVVLERYIGNELYNIM